MTSPSNSDVQNLLPVQAYFNLDGSFSTFIGQGVAFYATANPVQSGLTITNSTLNSSPIGGTSPSTGVFTNIATTTGTISTQPTGATDIVNLLALQSYAAGISWKQPCAVGTLVNITLSGLQTIDGYTTLAGDRVLVKNQATAANNGIYLASATAWTRSLDANSWDELISAISFLEYGSQAGGAWYCTAQPGGTLGVTAVNWSQFTTSATYSAGTGLTLTGTVFSITNIGTAGTYGSATQTPVFTTNAQGQVTAVTNTTITPALSSITGFGTGVATALAVNIGSAGAFVVNGGALGTPTSGNFSSGTFTWPTFNQSTSGNAATATIATNLAGGLAGSLPYQSALNTTTFLAAGTNGQVLTLASGVPSWATPTTGTVTSVTGTAPISSTGGNTPVISISQSGASSNGYLSSTDWNTFNSKTSNLGTVTSVSGTGTVNGLTLSGTVITSGNLTLGGTLDLSSPPAIGGTTPAAGTFTTLRINSTLSLAGSTGTSGYVVTSNGASAPTWQAIPATGLDIVDDTTTNATRYVTFTSATSGNITTENVSSTKLQYNPSTGLLSTTGLNLSGLTASSAVATDASKNLVSVTNTGSGNNVLATSPTVTTPIVATTIGVGGATPSGSGAGITFPATQSASSDVNTLDDYEEGTWTPTYTAVACSFTYSEQYGSYVKVGSLVTAQFRIRSASATGTTANSVQITGFPFTSANLGSLSSAAGAVGLNTFPTIIFPEMTPNSTAMNPWNANSPSIATALNSVNSYLMVTVSYRASN